jgi:hypothetical protein
MADDQAPDSKQTAELKEHQRDQELLEREQLSEAQTDAEVERHRRRADKARYLREKLEEREQSEREAASDQ